jgi:hypothetical protein
MGAGFSLIRARLAPLTLSFPGTRCDVTGMGAAYPTLDLPAPGDRLYAHCLFCGEHFPPNPMFGPLPPGLQLAYDPARSRLWSICGRCRRWNLLPVEERYDAIDLLEHTVSGRAELIARSDNIALYRHDELQILRIGSALFLERTTWRYGSYAARVASATAEVRGERIATALGAAQRLNTVPGLGRLTRNIDTDRALDLVRWSRFGSIAWDGRAPCRYCGSVLQELHYDISWWLYPRIDGDRLVIGVPCTRCDPWTPEKVFDVTGEDGHVALRRVLAYQLIGARKQRAVREASQLLQRAGSADRLLQEMSTGRMSLWRMGTERTFALAIALDHLAEKRLIDEQLRGYESEWRLEEDLARIIDDELS